MIPKPILSPAEAAAKIQDGQTIMAGGFMACGTPLSILMAMRERGFRNLTLISNDTAIHDVKTGRITGLAHLVLDRAFSRIIASHIGLNQETQRQMNAGETQVDLVPQGTLAERIRAGGAGLGGFLTPTGIGTEVAEGKQVIAVDGKSYLLELPIRADVALIKAKVGDKAGNLIYAGTARNFNPVMATAADLVIAEVEELVEIGEMDPNHVQTPSIFVDCIVKSDRAEA